MVQTSLSGKVTAFNCESDFRLALNLVCVRFCAGRHFCN